MLTKDSPILTNYLKGYCNGNDCTFVFIKKIVQEREIKLKEFNYKLLDGILPCNKNLMKWKLKIYDKCDTSNIYCRSVKPLWEIVEKMCGFEITFKKILGIEGCYSQDRIPTLISFFIYKEWLLLSLDSKKRHGNIKFYIFIKMN